MVTTVLRAKTPDTGRRGVPKQVRLDATELSLLSLIADCHTDDAFEVDFSEGMKLPKVRLDYHLHRMVRGDYIQVVFTDPIFGENFEITQKGRNLLVKKHLI